MDTIHKVVCVNNLTMEVVQVKEVWKRKLINSIFLLSFAGNNNKFKSIEECEDTCVENEFKLMLTNKCEQPMEEGPW